MIIRNLTVSKQKKQKMLKCGGLTTGLLPCAPPGEEAEKSEANSRLRRREGCGEGVFNIGVYFSLPYCDLISNKFN